MFHLIMLLFKWNVTEPL